MRYKTFYNDGDLDSEGDLLDATSDISVPTCGTISIELPDGTWLNVTTSEWLTVTRDKAAIKGRR